MKVRELIVELGKVDPEAEVMVPLDHDDTFSEWVSLSEVILDPDGKVTLQ